MLITSEKDFKAIKNFLDKHFYLEKTLHNQFFKEKFERFSFDVFAYISEEEFWTKILKPLSKQSGDLDLFFAMIDEDFSQELIENFGFYFAFKISVNSSTEEYFNFLGASPEKDPDLTPFVAGSSYVWIPESGKWAIYANRDFNVCILAFAKNCNIPTPHGRGWWLPVKAALHHFVKIIFPRDKIPQPMEEAFLKNYGK